MINKEFFSALDAFEKEYKIDKEVLITSLEAGLVSAFKKETGETRSVSVKLNPEKNTIKFFAYYTVVEAGEEELDDCERTLEEALELNPKAKVGDIIGEDVTPKQLSRIAAQTAKQVIMQRINDVKKEQIMAEMSEKEGELMNAVIRRVEPNAIYLELIGSQMEGVMTLQDQVFCEKYDVNDKIKVYVKKIRTTARGSQVMVSRSSAGFVKKLFEMEVPEIKSKLVTIKNIVREAGYRTKLSVIAEDPNIDPVGAAVGNKGVRVNAVVSELNGEKIDIVPFCQDPTEYVARALSPATVLMVKYNEEDNQARVIVSDDKLSLAIGKNGQNARLAAKLTGFKIDVKPYSKVVDIDDINLMQPNQ